MLIAFAIIAPLLRTALKRSPENNHVPDQHPAVEPATPRESVVWLTQYIMDVDRLAVKIQADQAEILRLIRTPDGGSRLEHIQTQLTTMNALLRHRSKRKQNG